MSQHRVAIKPLLLLFLWAVTLLRGVSAKDIFKYSDDLAEFVPECGSHCFVAFLNSHFTRPSCKESSLECLCTQRGAGGFTIGEGAVQCLEAESTVGLCRDGGVSRGEIHGMWLFCAALTLGSKHRQGVLHVLGTAGSREGNTYGSRGDIRCHGYSRRGCAGSPVANRDH